eukprot:scaffold1302_cov113-Skeletonema_marinoi.AAC.13
MQGEQLVVEIDNVDCDNMHIASIVSGGALHMRAVRDGPKKLGYLQFNFDFVNKSSRDEIARNHGYNAPIGSAKRPCDFNVGGRATIYSQQSDNGRPCLGGHSSSSLPDETVQTLDADAIHQQPCFYLLFPTAQYILYKDLRFSL